METDQEMGRQTPHDSVIRLLSPTVETDHEMGRQTPHDSVIRLLSPTAETDHEMGRQTGQESYRGQHHQRLLGKDTVANHRDQARDGKWLFIGPA